MIIMTDTRTIWNWYSRESVQKAILEVAKNREVVSVHKDSTFGRRPDIIQYPRDIVQAIANGTIAFHGSVERWHQPMKLDVGMLKQDLDNLRSGFDIVIDPDVPDFEIAKITVKQIIEALKDHGVKNYSLKSTGGKGFHIGIPSESLPEKINLQQTSMQYPDIPQKIIEYIKFYVNNQLKIEMLAIANPREISQRINKPLNNITNANGLEPFKVVSMDVFGSRHLFRLPYSLHEKTLLVSLPIKPENIDKFQKEHALPEKVKVEEKFLIPKVKMHDAEALVVEALDWAAKHKTEIKEELPKTGKARVMREIPEQHFPPCVLLINKGLADGRKRSLFILINFLRNMGWDLEKIEKKLVEWNEKNYPPLRANYLRTQLRWHIRQDRNLLPPNCDNENFYKAIGVCKPDEHCKNLKNPVNYPFRVIKRPPKKIKR